MVIVNSITVKFIMICFLDLESITCIILLIKQSIRNDSIMYFIVVFYLKMLYICIMNLPKAAKNLRLKFHNQVKHYLPKDFVLSNDTTIVTNTIEELNKFTDMNSFNLIESKITKTGKTLSYYYTVKTGNMTLVET